jgi:hypothetical protein
MLLIYFWPATIIVHSMFNQCGDFCGRFVAVTSSWKEVNGSGLQSPTGFLLMRRWLAQR